MSLLRSATATLELTQPGERYPVVQAWLSHSMAVGRNS